MSFRSLKYSLVLASFAAMPLAAQAAKKETEKDLKAEAKISMADAKKTALAEVPGGKIKSSELEREKGNLIYSFDIKVKGKKGIEEVNVDAISGKVIAHEHEDAKAEKKEAKDEKKEAKKAEKKP